MDCSTPGFPVLHCLPEFAQTYVHWVGDAIQSSHPLLPPSAALNLSQHPGLFQWVSTLHQLVKVLELQIQYQSIQWIFRVDFLGLTGLVSFGCPDGKESPCNAGDLGSIPGLERSPGEGEGYPLQYSGLGNSMDCIGNGVTQSQTRLSVNAVHILLYCKAFVVRRSWLLPFPPSLCDCALS